MTYHIALLLTMVVNILADIVLITILISVLRFFLSLSISLFLRREYFRFFFFVCFLFWGVGEYFKRGGALVEKVFSSDL